jgi:polysaccharide export outer membrane protein
MKGKELIRKSYCRLFLMPMHQGGNKGSKGEMMSLKAEIPRGKVECNVKSAMATNGGFARRVAFAMLCAIVIMAVGFVSTTPLTAEEIRLPGVGYTPGVSSVSPGSTWSANQGEEVYRIGPNDVIEISVWQSPDLNRTITVRFDGRISFPLVGEIPVAGMTTNELAAEIAERLREFVRSPQVSVSVKEFQSRQVLVLGKVGRSGIYPMRGPMKLLEILTAAGINLPEVDLKSITVMRATGEVLKLDLEALLYRQDVRQNIDLRAGDNIFVPEKPSATMSGPQAKEIMVLGEVTKPGAHSFPADRAVTVKEILLAAGGLTSNASLHGAKVIRSDRIQEPTDLNKLIFNADMSQDLTLYAGDVLYVPKRKDMRIYVLGMVQRQGVIEGQPNTLDLLQVMALAVPAQFGAVLSNVKVVRGWPNNPRVISANVEALLYRGRLEENIPLQEGDVVYVPESFLSNTMDVISRVLSPLSGTLGFINTAQTVSDRN